MAQTETIEMPVEVVDKATGKLTQIGKEVQKMAVNEKAQQSFSALNQQQKDLIVNSQKASVNVQKQTGSMTDLASAVSLVKQGVQVLKQGFEFAREGASIQRLEESGREVARQFGGDMDLIVEKVSAASLNTVSKTDIIAASNRAMMLGLGADADRLAQLMEVAAFRGRAMGLSTTQAFNDIATGIGRNSPMILDNLGIITKGWAEEAKAAGVAYDQQFILNKVLEQGGAQLEEAGGLAEDAATQYEQLAASWQDLSDSAKKASGEGLAPFLDDITATIDRLADTRDEAQENIKWWERLVPAVGVVHEAYTFLVGDQDKLNKTFRESDKILDSAADQLTEQQRMMQAVRDGTAGASQAQNIYNLSAADALALAPQITQMNEKQAEQEKKLTDQLNEQVAARDKAVLMYGAASQKVQEYNNNISQLESGLAELAESHEDASRRILSSVLETRGATEEQRLDYALASGEISEEAYDQQTAIQGIADQLINNKITAEEAAAATDFLFSSFDKLKGQSAEMMVKFIFDIVSQSGTNAGSLADKLGIGSIEGLAAGGKIKSPVTIVGDAPGGGFTPYTEAVINGMVFDAKTTKQMKDAGLFGDVTSRAFGGPIDGPSQSMGVDYYRTLYKTPSAQADSTTESLTAPILAGVSQEVSKQQFAMQIETARSVKATQETNALLRQLIAATPSANAIGTSVLEGSVTYK